MSILLRGGGATPLNDVMSRSSHNHNDTDKTDRDTNAFDSLI